VSKSSKASRLSEAKVKLSLGDWLTGLGFKVFDERKTKERPKWGVFEVRNINRGKRPDLLVRGTLAAAQTSKQGVHVAIEIKPGYKHQDILDGFDAVLDYFSDYLWGAEYLIDEQPIEIAAFVLATFFSSQGFLFEEEGKFEPRGVVKGPWDAYPMTFTVSRLLWRQKDNLVKRFQTLAGIPKVEEKLKGRLHTGGAVPEIGVLVKNPTGRQGVRLMLSKNPYHWRFESM
jgi:hypothetical protein